MSEKDPDQPMFDDPILMEHKYNYITRQGEFKDRIHYPDQSSTNCIICRIVEEDPSTPGYEIYRNDKFIVFLNLFPYTSGHIMISPLAHMRDYEDFSTDLAEEMGVFIQRCIRLVKTAMRTDSVNVGWNQGPVAGGSIKHWHAHVVPRYPNELNFIEIIARSRPVIQSLELTQNILKEHVHILDGSD